ncbi:hypothetical protein PHAVU_008G122133 [Phaseolus vulgaris]|uniref:Replication factor A C-terminal domain-containing protein n=1 Tax=Phaseolus vulgaris TaxID=3885 RepID=V7BDZ8_PHAVU|nr:hypothetical protein PHAVU_007G125300g [Phaseolus vulgaris]ESW16057.1 hypothetical protein PHAVU_007G125300g [Phaseolus vulgaris]
MGPRRREYLHVYDSHARIETPFSQVPVLFTTFRVPYAVLGDVGRYTNYVDELNVFVSSGEVQNVVVSIEFSKVYIQNCIDCTKVQFNLNTEAALALKKRMSSSSELPSQGLSQLFEASKHSLEVEFLQLTPRNTIGGLKDYIEVNRFIILGTIKHVVDDDDWWYTACVCNKAVYPDSKMFFCEKCNKHVMKVSLKYKIKLRVVDEPNSTTFILFDREANSLSNKSCAKIFESHDKIYNLSKEFSDLLDKSFLFKVDSRNDQGIRLEQSFRVKKVCFENQIIQTFIEGRIFILIIWFLRDVTILTVSVDKQNSRNTRMKRRNILAQKSMNNKQKVSSTINEGESEKFSQLISVKTCPP